MSHIPVLGARVFELVLEADRELAAEARAAGCSCGGRLHSARYPRKPWGGVPADFRAEYGSRESLCCAREGCRRRTTPASLRFFGRRRYLGVLVVLISAMSGGAAQHRAQKLAGSGVDVSLRTLQRWRAWWLRTFPRTAFWKDARARLAEPVDERRLPASLLERFDDSSAGVVACLRFLAPVNLRGGYTMGG